LPETRLDSHRGKTLLHHGGRARKIWRRETRLIHLARALVRPPSSGRQGGGARPFLSWNHRRIGAVVDAAVHRTRPVALTAAATALAMIPLTHSVFWGPMAIAIMGGLTAATFLTIFFVPALYAAWFKVRRAPAPGPAGVPDRMKEQPA